MTRIRHLGVALLVAAVAVTVAGLIDHHVKTGRMDRAEVSEWYCGHDGTRCGGPSSVAIERRWNERERGYKIALGVLIGCGVGCVVLSYRGGRREASSVSG